ncbi:MAG: Gfo/Idh/MocA family oxidoreductase [Pseudomonadota bacterium]
MAQRPIGFGVIGADHIHIYRMAADMVAAGGVFKGWWTRNEPEPSARVFQAFPNASRLADYRTLLDDKSIDLILIGAMPGERAGFAIESMRAGKDVMTDKPGATTLEDLAQVRVTAAATGRFWSVAFSERYWVRAMLKAAELVEQGAIGQVIHTTGLGPHRGILGQRHPWFFRRESSGGILGDIASHQIDSFIHFTGSRAPRIVAASVGNFTRPDHPEFEDFGEVLLHGESASGYLRVDWLTPDGQPYSSDSRFTVLGTEGVVEVRKYVDLCGQPGTDHLLLVRGDQIERIDCSAVPIRYFTDIADDVRERSTSAERPGHSYLVTELALRAGQTAVRLGHLANPDRK